MTFDQTLKLLISPFISDATMGIVMLVLFLVFLMLGFPIAFTLMAMGIFFGYYARGDSIFLLFVNKTYGVMSNDVLLSIPLFLFMGYVVERANILDRLFRSIQLAAFWLPGSLAVATLATCALFATATGIVGAVVTLMGLLAFPAMLRAGYDTRLAAGVVCAGGCLGILIPPSVMLILYGATAGVSVVKLYAAAFFPGLMLASLYMVYVIILTYFRPELAPKLKLEDVKIDNPFGSVSAWLMCTLFATITSLILWLVMGLLGLALIPWLGITVAKALPYAFVTALLAVMLYVLRSDETRRFFALVSWELVKSFFPLALLILGVLGAIMFGLATPQEAAAIGALGAMILALAYNANYGQSWRRVLLVLYVLAFLAVAAYLAWAWSKGIARSNQPIHVMTAMTAAVFLALAPGNAFSWEKMRESVYLTARASAMVCWLFVGSAVFSAVFAQLGGQKVVEDFVLSLNLSPVMFLILTQIIIFILGWPLEWTEIIVIFLPIFLPLLDKFGIDPIFFGVLVALNLQTSFLSPPVAMAPFYLKGVAPKHVTINEIFSGVYPFLAIVVFSMALFYVFPQIGMWLPGYLYGSR